MPSEEFFKTCENLHLMLIMDNIVGIHSTLIYTTDKANTGKAVIRTDDDPNKDIEIRGIIVGVKFKRHNSPGEETRDINLMFNNGRFVGSLETLKLE